MAISLGEWARSRGVAYATANRWFHAGRLPCRAEQAATGRREIRVYPDEPPTGCTCANTAHVQCMTAKLRVAGYAVVPLEQARAAGLVPT